MIKRAILGVLLLSPIALPLAVKSFAADKAERAEAQKLVTAAGTVSESDGLKAWAKIEAVVTHPRCANCHTDNRNIPMWSGPEHAKAQPHGMNINAGESRIGAEELVCSTCHMTSKRPNTVPRAAPHAGIPWQLAPVEFLWFDQPGKVICEQMRDPKRNGDRDAIGVVEHILHDRNLNGFILWGWNPGPGRETPPGTWHDHLDDTVKWAAAGMPCPN